ncbi:MAG: hypothetical protein IKH52_04070 [Bacteroidaceae bacterium]|nr:hypothetical protein [Bacteroidaceae bacterium]
MIQQDYTPEALAVKKAQLRELISAKRDAISRMVDELITPDPATTRAEQFATTFSRAIAIADGALTGYRLVKRLGWLVPKRKKRRK